MLRLTLGFIAFIVISDMIATFPFLSTKIKILLYFVSALIVSYEIYVFWYFHSKQFLALKNSLKKYTEDCNNLNSHIEKLKSTQLEINAYDYGDGTLHDKSRHLFKRLEWAKSTKNANTHHCSASVCKAANDQPFKYLCKYFDIKINENTLSHLEIALNNYLAAYQGKILLEQERDRLMMSLTDPTPSMLYILNKQRLAKELGFEPISVVDINFQAYKFQYISSGGNSSYEVSIVLDMKNLEKLIKYLGDILQFRNSAKGQRALMTPQLREKIKQRDNYTCQICGASVLNEKNLLIEIDHIIPISKGGTTTEENLQALCWRCNRTKGSNISHK